VNSGSVKLSASGAAVGVGVAGQRLSHLDDGFARHLGIADAVEEGLALHAAVELELALILTKVHVELFVADEFAVVDDVPAAPLVFVVLAVEVAVVHPRVVVAVDQRLSADVALVGVQEMS
jgi:hypothetical protein